MESANLRKSRGFQRLDRGSGEFEKVHWRRRWNTFLRFRSFQIVIESQLDQVFELP